MEKNLNSDEKKNGIGNGIANGMSGASLSGRSKGDSDAMRLKLLEGSAEGLSERLKSQEESAKGLAKRLEGPPLRKESRADGSERVVKDSANLAILVRHSLEIRNGLFEKLYRDDFRESRRLCFEGREVTFNDDHSAIIHERLQKYYFFKLTRQMVNDAIDFVFAENAGDSLMKYVDSLPAWDGKGRVSHFLPYYFGAEDKEYTREVSRVFFIQAISRALEPGCQADYMLVLMGHQGAEKSRALSLLGGEFHKEINGTFHTKDWEQCLHGAWIAEIPEFFPAKSQSNSDIIKAKLTTRIDTYRPSYGRNVRDFPRRSVFIGTTNRTQFLNDPTGGRRFWPMEIGKIKYGELKDDVEQIWAEALHLYKVKSGDWWSLGSAECDALERQESARVKHPWEDQIDGIMTGIEAGMKDESGAPVQPTSATILSLLNALRNEGNQTELVGVMHKTGYMSKQKAIDGKRYSLWTKK